MSAHYNPAWSNANGSGLVDSTRYHCRSDLAEIAAAINRRRLLVIQKPWDYASLLNARPYISQYVIDDSLEWAPDNAYNFRRAILSRILPASPGMDNAYLPSNPASIQWLWPLADADENKTIASWVSGQSSTHVGLFNRLNGGAAYTDDFMDVSLMKTQYARAVHINELRRALEWLRRGRWIMPLYWLYGMIPLLPGTPWFGGMIAKDGNDEIRGIGGFRPHVDKSDGLAYGLHGVQALAATITLMFSASCQVELLQVLRPVTYGIGGPTWQYYNSDSQLAWGAPGGLGPGDSAAIGTYSATANTPLVIPADHLLSMWQAMLDGTTSPFFMLRRLDSAPEHVEISAASSVTLDFELDSPPA